MGHPHLDYRRRPLHPLTNCLWLSPSVFSSAMLPTGKMMYSIVDLEAVQACPDSFKTHKSLAYALYEKDPEFKDIDRIIEEGETRAPDYRSNPDCLSPPRRLLPDQRRSAGAKNRRRNTRALRPPALPWYQKSAATLARTPFPSIRNSTQTTAKKNSHRGRKPDRRFPISAIMRFTGTSASPTCGWAIIQPL